MIVKEISFSEDLLEKRDYRDGLEIMINGKQAFSVFDGEPEDANLSRDFNDCWKVTDLMRIAYNAGKEGEDFILESETIDEL